MQYCKICDSYTCDKHTFSFGKVAISSSFTGSSPPEIFVGRWNYPSVYTGILSPPELGDTASFSSPEKWHEQNASIKDILSMRNRLIYGRQQHHIKMKQSPFLGVMQEVAMTYRPLDTEFILSKPIEPHTETEKRVPLIRHAASVSSVRLTENTRVKPKVDYLVSDNEVMSKVAISELSKGGIETSSIIKLLSAGLLGKAKNRKLVPTRWSVTAVDDTLSKNLLEKIRTYQQLSHIEVFAASYVGNHYVFLLLPGMWSFEVIELSLKNLGVWQDYEGFTGRKKYADDVTGAYYANRLAACEYLEKIKRQASVLVLREIRPEYTDPLGVGILRETSRAAFRGECKKYSSVKEALREIQPYYRVRVEHFSNKSWLLKQYGKQKTLSSFF